MRGRIKKIRPLRSYTKPTAKNYTPYTDKPTRRGEHRKTYKKKLNTASFLLFTLAQSTVFLYFCSV